MRPLQGWDVGSIPSMPIMMKICEFKPVDVWKLKEEAELRIQKYLEDDVKNIMLVLKYRKECFNLDAVADMVM